MRERARERERETRSREKDSDRSIITCDTRGLQARPRSRRRHRRPGRGTRRQRRSPYSNSQRSAAASAAVHPSSACGSGRRSRSYRASRSTAWQPHPACRRRRAQRIGQWTGARLTEKMQLSGAHLEKILWTTMPRCCKPARAEAAFAFASLLSVPKMYFIHGGSPAIRVFGSGRCSFFQHREVGLGHHAVTLRRGPQPGWVPPPPLRPCAQPYFLPPRSPFCSRCFPVFSPRLGRAGPARQECEGEAANPRPRARAAIPSPIPRFPG